MGFYNYFNFMERYIHVCALDRVVPFPLGSFRDFLVGFHLKNKFLLCNWPTSQGMIPLVKESLLGIVYIQLKDVIKDKILFEDSGICARIEYGWTPYIF